MFMHCCYDAGMPECERYTLNFLSRFIFCSLFAFTAMGTAYAADTSATLTAQPKIINGQAALPRQVPWQLALLQVSTAGDLYYTCGATLINAQWVVTAAHCVDSIDTGRHFEVLAGTYNLTQRTQAQQIKVRQVIMHSGYQAGVNLDNDIALLKLAQPVDLESCGARCQVIPWMSTDKEPLYAATGFPAQVAGWGQMINIDCEKEAATCQQLRDDSVDGAPLQPSILQVGQMQVSSCPNISYSMAGRTWPMTSNMMCATGRNATAPADTCAGDSGSGLIANIAAAQPILTGITSWGQDADCGDPAHPGVYTRVSQYDDWLLSYIDPAAYKQRVAEREAQAKTSQSSGGGGGGSMSVLMLAGLAGLAVFRRKLLKI